MDLSAIYLEQITSPLEVVNLLGHELHKVHATNYYTTKCPKCESKLHILDKEFVCENSGCVFRAGSVVDYLVAAKKCSWDTALETLNTILDNRLQNTTLFKNKSSVTKYFKTRRRVFDFFLRIALQGSVNNMHCLQYRNALKNQGIDVELLKWGIYVVSGKDTTILRELVKDGNKINDTCIVLPYFSSYHKVSHILVLNSPLHKPELFEVEPSRISYFGLLQRHPKNNVTKLAYTYAEAAKLNTQYSRVSPENVCLHMMLDAAKGGDYIVFPEVEYVITNPADDNFRAVATIQKYLPSVAVDTQKINLYAAEKIESSDIYLAKSLIKEIKAGKNIISLLDLINLKADSKQLLLKKLHEEKYFDEAEEVRNYFKSLPIYNDDKQTLYSNPFGYTLKKSGKDTFINSITNFIVELEQNVVFAESTDIFHAGNVTFNGDVFPVILTQDDVEKAADLEKAVRRATLGSPGESALINLPTVKDRGGAKYLISYLREQISSLPRTEGLPMLGWSPRRTSFYAPYFIADKKGSRLGKKYFHPNNQALSLFTNDSSTIGQLHLDLPEPISEVISQCAAIITRSYLSMPVRAIPVYNSSEARALLSALFSALGQTSVAQLNHNIRGEDSPGIRGFPHYAVGYVSSQANKSSLPAFILCDAGLVINEHFSAEILEQAKQTLKLVVQKVAEWAITTEAASFTQVQSVSRTAAYTSEGTQVIIDSCNLMSWPHSKKPFENLDNLLANIRPEEVKQYFVKDIHRHITQIKKEVFNSSSDLNKITEELQQIAKKVLVTEDTIDVDSDSMLEALTSFYQTTPTLAEKFDAEKMLDDFSLR